eukprot:GILI01004349.1.p1 GENE.GILI01004349.1~~GILI01004349.1.p1  ORF type:complete len:994 (+),score=247.21 GILI01004349.1:50-2983(+)
MTWEDQGLFFTLILNAVVVALLVAISYYFHSNTSISIARVFRPNHTIPPPEAKHGATVKETKSVGNKNPSVVDQDDAADDVVEEILPHTVPTDEAATLEANEDCPPKKETEDDDQMGRLDMSKKSSLFSLPPLRRLLSVGEEAWEADGDEEPLRRDPHADLFLMFAKVSMVIFLICTTVSTTWLALACGLDNYLAVLTFTKDPAECRGSNNADCDDNPLCLWTGATCEPKISHGLYDLSLGNVTPKSSRLWAVGILALLFSILCTAAMYRALMSITDYHRRVLKRQLMCAIGYRTVLVKGLSLPPNAVMQLPCNNGALSVEGYTGSDPQLFLSEYLSGCKYTMVGKPDDYGLFSGRDQSTGVSSKVEEVVVEREAHKRFYDAYNDYEEAKTALQDAIAAERKYHEDLIAQRKVAYALLDDGTVKDKSGGNVTYEKETALPPLMGTVLPKCCSSVPMVEHRKKDLIEKGEKLNEAILEGRSMPFTGSVFVIFKDALSAFEFVDLFNDQFGHMCSSLSARIAGPFDKIELANLTKHKYVGAVLFIIMVACFVVLVFFWSVPVAFLGSMSSLASVPGIGPAFQAIIKALPVTLVGILTAYLPVIVLAIFNIVLPMIIRFFVLTGGSMTSLETDHGVMLEMYLFLVLTGVVFQAALQGGISQLGTIIADPSQDVIFAFVTAIISPKGGYWFASVIGAGCLSMWINALWIGPFIVMKLLAKRSTTQRGYNAIFAHQAQDWPLKYAFTLVISTIGLFFHVTVPFLGVFVGIFFLNQYFVYRGLLLDGWAPALVPDELVSNFKFPACNFRIMSVCYLIATIGAAIVVGLKEHIGGLVFCCIAVVVGAAMLIMTFYLSSAWEPTLKNAKLVLSPRATICGEEAGDVPVMGKEQPKTEIAASPTNKKDTRKPYHSLHGFVTEPVTMADDIREAEELEYRVVMHWHSAEDREEVADDRVKAQAKDGKELAEQISNGKHKQYSPELAV